MSTALVTQPHRTVTAQLMVFDMHCWECAGMLEMALEAFPGVEKADVNALSGVTEITFRPDQVTIEDISAAIEGSGYEGRVAIVG